MTGSLQVKNGKYYMVLNSTENGKTATLRTSASKNNKAALNLLQSNATIVSIVIICRLLQRLSCLH